MISLTALNALGKRFSFEIQGDYTYSPWYSSIKVIAPLNGRVPDQLKTRDFNISPAGNHDYFMSVDLKAEPYARLSAGDGGEFVFCASENPRLQGLAMWRGEHHEIAAYMPSTWARDPSFGLSWFEGLTFNDDPDGLVVSCDRSTVVAESMDISIANVGYLYIHNPQSGLSFVPEHSGARLGRGELWKQVAGGGRLESLVFAFPSAVAVSSVSNRDAANRMLDLFKKITVLEYEV